MTRELGVISFDEMISRAATLLKNHKEVQRFEFNRLRAFLVDEFQDTDPCQLELVSNLLKRPSDSKDDMLGFFVGDTKQSIYRFRGVEVRSVLRFFEDYEVLVEPIRKKEEFHLQTNFRSCASVTGFANSFFSKGLKLANDSDLLFPFRDEPGLPAHWIELTLPVQKNAFSAEESRQLTAEVTVSLIDDYVNGNRDALQYKDILVLTRSNRELDTLLPALQKAGIPVVASGARTYYQNHEVLDLLNLLIALFHPFDTIAVAAVLRSPLVGLCDDQIHHLFKKVPSERLLHSEEPLPDFLPEGPHQKILSFRQLVSMRRDHSFLEWLHQVRAQIPAPAYTYPSDSEGRAIVRISRLLSTFREEVQHGSSPPIVWLLRQRSKASALDRWDEDCGEDVNLSDEGVNAVRALTIHKAKGLEAPIVIIPSWTTLLEESLGTRPRRDKHLLKLTDTDGSELKALSLKWGPLNIVSANHLDAIALEDRYHREEAGRLAYVAVTRARDQLILLQTPSKYLEENLLNSIRHGSDTEVSSLSEIRDRKQVKPTPELLLDVAAHKLLWQKKSEASKTQHPLLQHPTDFEFRQIPVPARKSGSSSLATGRLVHRYLEKRLEGHFDKSLLERLWEESRTHDSDPGSLQQAKRILTDFFGAITTDSAGRPLFERIKESSVLGQELPVFLTIDNQAWSGVIDLILQEDVTIYAIDFKTGIAVHQLQDTYAQQKRVYSEAVRRLFPSHEVKFEFWWLNGSLCEPGTGTGD
jgi:ATP-dependent helicase/nuclease subunit A